MVRFVYSSAGIHSWSLNVYYSFVKLANLDSPVQPRTATVFVLIKLVLTSINWESTQTRHRQQRESHLKMQLRISTIISQLFKVTMLAKCVFTILELNWNQRFRGKKMKLSICLVCSCRPHNSKRGHFTSWKERGRLRNFQKWKMHVQSVHNFAAIVVVA